MSIIKTMVAITVLVLVANFALAQPKPGSAPSEVLAEGNGISILANEIEEPLKETLYSLERQKYEARMKELEQRIAKLLIEQEARSRGISAEQLYKQEIQSKLVPVSEEAAREFFNENKARISGTFEEYKDRIMEFLSQRQAEQRVQDFLASLRAKANIKVFLKEPEEPRYDVSAANNPFQGNPQALVTIIEFTDFECPVCKQALPIVKEVVKTYGDKVRLVVRDFPLPSHPLARKAAEAAGCASQQGKYWEYHDLLFEKQPRLEPSQLKEYAQGLGLDGEAFSRCLDEAVSAPEVEKDVQDGLRVAVKGTPTFFINGKKLRGQYSLANFKRMIDQELEQPRP